MKAAVVHALNEPFVVRDDLTLDSPIGHEVLVDVKASGLCHSDIIGATVDIGAPFPAIFGHEVAGVAVQIGPDVQGVSVGDHVVACLAGFCGHCDRCLNGETYRCRNYPLGTERGANEEPRMRLGGEPIGQTFDVSGFAEQVLMHENHLAVIPAEVPFPQASLLGCGVVTGAGAAINTAGVRVGDLVAVIGCGGVGLNVIQGARLAGARRVIAVDVVDGKLELAKRFGATDTVNSRSTDAVAAVQQLSDGGVDYSFEVIGRADTLRQAIGMLCRGGLAFAIGMSPPATSIDVHPAELLMYQRGVRGVFMGSTNPKRDIPMYADLYLQRRFDLDDLVSQEISLDDINEAYAELAKGGIARSVVTTF